MSHLNLSALSASASEHQIDVYDRLDPAVECGSYLVLARQTVDDQGEVALSASGTFKLDVEGPRFRLHPEHVLGCFPPPGAQDVAWNRLPHIALTRRTLPWERNVAGWTDGQPWLALLVLREGEYTGGGPITTNLGELPEHLRSAYIGEDESCHVQLIRVKQSVLPEILIPLCDVQLACHARRLPVGDQDARGDEDGFIAVVMANRLCAKGAPHLACLVSLEGQAAAIERNKYESFLPAQAGVIGWEPTHAFVILHTWDFTTGQDGDFEAMITRLDLGRLGGGASLPFLASDGAPSRLVKLQGALVPEPPPRPPAIDAPQELAWSAADIVGTARGANDGRALSTALAFELGRTLTLANQPVLAALQRFRTAPWDLHLDQALAQGLLADAAAVDPQDVEVLRAALHERHTLPLPGVLTLPSADVSGTARLDPTALTALATVRSATDGARAAALALKAGRTRNLSAAQSAEAAEAPFAALLSAATHRDDL